ncbi:MAG TPA: methylated-DNA--[protein]-cysteine S-methyltransferase [Candidatus Dormibacteraeota bacterium]|nr:methylated-DNA--[protein]-cysteine S-methyltransferase [Candidatus Dormibacteraeota bacterium]
MTARGFALFDTAIGRCGVAWNGDALAGVQLPESGERATRARLQRRFPAAREAPPPKVVARAIDGIRSLLGGAATDLSAVVLDLGGVPPFHRKVYEAARAIPPGATVSYGEIAARVGAPGSARAVGQALGRNPFAIVVPCHRVLAANGRLGGFSANGGAATKLRMLSIEGAHAAAQRGLFDGDGAFAFDLRAAVDHVRAADPALARIIDAVGPFAMELKRTPSIFAALAEAIVYQQLSGKAAATIYGRVCALFPRSQDGPTAANIVRATDDKLRGAGLSRAKLLALRDLAQRELAGEIPSLADARGMDDAALIESLTAVRGIGRWTVEMLLMFRLGRPDVLPVDDYGIRKGFAIALRKRDLPERRDLERRGARWKPYRTVASWYLWRAVELANRTGQQ